jgi:S1-C subfamily serine protease
MSDMQPTPTSPNPTPPAGGTPTHDFGADALAAQVTPRAPSAATPPAASSAVTQPVTWTPAATATEAAAPAPATAPAAPGAFAAPASPIHDAAPANQPAPRTPRRRGGAAILVAVLATAVLSSGGTYLAISAANDTAEPPASNAALPGAAATPTPAPATDATPAPATAERSVVDIVKAVSPAVVTIVAEGVSQESTIFGQGGSGTATGSGVIFDAAGLVLTNRHVVSGDPTAITVNLKDGRSLEGSIYGIDTLTDLAIVKVEGTDLPTAPIGDSSTIEVGQEAIAIGSPLGEFTDSVTSGIISALGRSIQVQDGTTISNLIQTDTAINPGNSGGPLLDRAGNVIGINTAVAGGAQGIGFAIPVNIARPLLAQASSGQELARAWLGVRFQTIDAELKAQAGLPVDQGAWIPTTTVTPATDEGILPAPGQDPDQGQGPSQGENPFGLTPEQLDELFRQFGIDPNQLPQGQAPFGQGGQGQGVQPAVQQPAIVAGSPAEAAGLLEGDIITAVNGTELTATNPLDLVVSQLVPGETASLEVLRDGQSRTISITLGTRPGSL